MLFRSRLPGFFGSSYVCAHCWKPYNTQGEHRCNKKKQCGACRQKECPDFQAAYPQGQKATRRCQQCHQDFFGQTCYQTHLAVDHAGKPVTNPQSSVCFLRRRCPNCRKQDVGVERIQRHQCYYVDCRSCHEYVHGKTHLCFIQRPSKPQEKKRKRKRQGGPRAKRGAAAAELQTAPEEEEYVTTCHPCTCFLILKPCNPTNNTLLISSWPKPKTTINLFIPRRILYPRFSRMAGYTHVERHPTSQCLSS